MSLIPVIWLSLHEGVDARGPWDTRILERLFAAEEWEHGIEFRHVQPGDGGDWGERVIVVLPAAHHTSAEDIESINAYIGMFDAVLLILCGDELGVFPWRDIQHPNIKFWVQAPDPEHYADMHDWGFFFGWGPANITHDIIGKGCNWMFAGQETNKRRKAAVEGLRRTRPTGSLMATKGFAQGLRPEAYAQLLDAAWVAPCPSGPANVDSFRLYEALEQGCIPIVDGMSPKGPVDYWRFVYDEVPFPIVSDWNSVGGVIEDCLIDRHYNSARASAWWQQRKREMAWRLRNDLTKLGFELPEQSKATGFITCSPSPKHPRLEMVQETIASIRHHFGDIEIIVACDGVRPEQEHLRARYEEYLYELCRWAEHGATNVVAYIATEWRHQALLTFEALTQLGCNELLMFCEHDTPLVTDWPIDVPTAIDVLSHGHLDVLRFHHEAHILEPHEWLMIDHETIDLAGLPVRRTLQWSQRPHLARSDYYLRILGQHFTSGSRTMIEDTMHGAVQSARPGRHRIAVYHPDTGGNIKRSIHLDGRGDEPKFDMKYR